MASIDRTAYPHFSKRLSDKELSNCYGLNNEEQDFIYTGMEEHPPHDPVPIRV